MRTILSFFLVLLFVAGCGGGSSVEGLRYSVYVGECTEQVRTGLICDENGYVREEYRIEEPTGELPPEDIESARAQGSGEGYLCGPSLNNTSQYQCRFTPPRSDNFEVCPSPDELTKFVDTFEPVNKFDAAPVLSFADSSTEYHKQLARESVSLLNRALPDEYDITESGVDVQGSDGGALQVPEGEIYIQFFPERPNVPVGLAVGRYIRIIGGAEHEIGNSSALRKSYVLFIAHEIMHVLGFSGHIDPPTDSIMMDGGYIIDRFVTDRNWPRAEILSAVDVWGIRYFYEDATGDPEEWLASRCQ